MGKYKGRITGLPSAPKGWHWVLTVKGGSVNPYNIQGRTNRRLVWVLAENGKPDPVQVNPHHGELARLADGSYYETFGNGDQQVVVGTEVW